MSEQKSCFELAHEVIARCRALEMKLAVAESCTGGLLGAALTSVAGASAVFEGGVLSYQNDVKAQLLGVSEETLRDVGAVSEACAQQMAAGAARLLKVDLAVSITGIAGPGGATEACGTRPGKPVGLVFIGLYCKGTVTAKRYQFAGDRSAVRAQAVSAALEEVQDALRKVSE